MGAPQAFLSYRTKRAEEVAPLIKALAGAGVDVWRDEERIDEGASISDRVLSGLADSQVLLAWYSLDYPASRICQWEQALAWVAAEAVGSPHQRVFLLLPPDVQRVDHVLGLPKEQKAWRVPAADSGEELASFARKLVGAIAKVDGRTLGELAPLRKAPPWLLRARAHPSERFTGRAKDLWAVHGHLHEDRLVAVTGRGGPSTAQVRGLGGIGKTLLAVEYVARFGAAFPGGVFWVDAAGHTAEGVLADVAIALGKKPEQRNEVKDALSKRGSYLWVADNLPAGLTQREVEAWCAPTPNGRTLVTTRSRTWEALGRVLDLEVLEPDEALLLLTKRRAWQGEAEKAAAAELCKSVGYHPLTLDVLGALVRRHPGEAPYAAWKERLAAPSEDALRLGEELKEELPTESAKYVGAVVRESLAGLEPEAMDLLRLSVTLAAEPIPAGLAVRSFARCLGRCKSRRPEDCWLIGVEAGQARSLLDVLLEPGPGYAVHALVRRVLAYDPGEQKRIAELRAAAVSVLPEMFDGVEDIRNHGRISPLVAHAERLEGELTTREEAALAHCVAYFHQVRGSFPEARSGWARALEARMRLLGAEYPDTLTTLQNLAVTLKAQGDLAGARSLEERALEARTRLLGAEHPATLTALQNLAGTLHAQGNLAGARSLYARALEARARLLGAEHPATLTTLQNLAVTLKAQGDLAGARSLYERALEARTRLLGAEHPDTLGTLQNLAVTLYAQGDLAGARSLYERALEVRTRLLGAEHPATLGTLQNLAVTLHAQGDLAGARSLYERALEAMTRLLGAEHPDTLTTLQNLAVTLKDQGDLAGARSLCERALEARTRLLGVEHPATLGTLQNLAVTLKDQGDLAGARSLEERALEARTRLFGAEHPDTLTALQNLAGTLYAQGDLAGARSLCERALEARTRLLGAEHPATLGTLQNLAETLYAQGDLAGARSLCERALEAMTRLLGAEHPDTLTTLQNLAGTLKAQGDLAGARSHEERALEAMTRLPGAEHPATAVTRFNLVLTLLRIDPGAAAPHVAILRRLRDRTPKSLSADERRILDVLLEFE